MDNSSKNIVLIGMPGCGKTTIGKMLAQKLGRKFIDIDELVEQRAGCTISELFQKGEEHFRNLETEAVLALENEKASVIATGGGVVKRAQNMASLKKNGIIVYIDRPLEEIAVDIDTGIRPLLAGGTGKLARLHAERDELYRLCSDLIIRNEGEIRKVAERIISTIKDYWR